VSPAESLLPTNSGAEPATSEALAGSVAALLDQQHHERYGTILADPPWQFMNRTGKMAPEHRRLNRYATMKLPEILALPYGVWRRRRAICTFGSQSVAA
jgi:hypothetical protein